MEVAAIAAQELAKIGKIVFGLENRRKNRQIFHGYSR